VISCLQKY